MNKDDENMLAPLRLVYKQLAKDHCVELLSLLTNPSSSRKIKTLEKKGVDCNEKTRFLALLPNYCFLKILEFLPLSSNLHIAEIGNTFSEAVYNLLKNRRYLRNCAFSGFENRFLAWPKIIGAGNWSQGTIERFMETRREVLKENGVVHLGVRLELMKRENKYIPDALLQLYKISKDIGRTLPSYLRTPELMTTLSRILGTYALSDPDVGYCQGINYLVGILIISMLQSSKPSPPEDDISSDEDMETWTENCNLASRIYINKRTNFSELSNDSEVTNSRKDRYDWSESTSPTCIPEILDNKASGKPTDLEYRIFALLDQLMRYNNIPEQEGLYRTIAPSNKSSGWSGDAAGGLNSKYGTLGYGLRYYYLPSLPRATIAFVHIEKLIRHFLPDLHGHFLKHSISPEIFCAEWYFTLFSFVLPLELTQRVWDVYLVDGTKALHRFALVVLTRLKPLILFKDFETTLKVLKSAKSTSNAKQLFCDQTDVKPGDGFIRQSLDYKVTNKSLHNLSSKLLEIVTSDSNKKETFHQTNVMKCSRRFALYQSYVGSVEKKAQVYEVRNRTINLKPNKVHVRKASASIQL